MNFRRSEGPDRPADRAESDRLLDAAHAGTPPAEGADPLTRLLSAASAPARPGELAGEQEALAAFRAVRVAGAAAPVAPARRRRGLTTGVVAWIGGIAATATAGAAFAAVTIDRPAEPPRPPVPAPGSTGGDQGGSSSPSGAGSSGGPTTTPGAVPSSAATTPGGPGKPAGAGQLAGQCRAYLAKSEGQRRQALASPGFADLVAAAGGAGQVTAYCQRLLPEGEPVTPSSSRASRTGPAPAGSAPGVPTPDARTSKKS
ncbi:hypothetical protein [Micromonospora sp. DT47]|uniref:hypothetical protein n=1 Tax=Micromonospora sp. DT47 TaxID=3393431 RepID=UPI003CF5E594